MNSPKHVLAPADDCQLAPERRPWLSLWVAIHFFTLAVCLVANTHTSVLTNRIYKLLAPYSVALHQDYGAVPLHIASDSVVDHPHQLEYHVPSAIDTAPSTENKTSTDQWVAASASGSTVTKLVDLEWKNFEHMLAVAADQKNEEVVQLVFEHLIQHLRDQQIAPDAVRLLRLPALSFSQSQQRAAGELPAAELEPEVLFECRIIRLGDERFKLLPVIERARRAKSVESQP